MPRTEAPPPRRLPTLLWSRGSLRVASPADASGEAGELGDDLDELLDEQLAVGAEVDRLGAEQVLR